FFASEFNALVNTNRAADAEKEALKLLDEAKDEDAANGPAWQAFWARLNRNEFDGAAQIADRYAQRFPEAENIAQYYSQLLQNLHQNKKKDEAAALVEKLSKAYPENAAYIDMRARMQASQGKFRDAAETVRQAIEKLSKLPPAKWNKLLGND